MNKQKLINYISLELEAIYEDLNTNVNQQILLKKFLKDLLDVIKSEEPFIV